jgi:hypothetical protein
MVTVRAFAVAAILSAIPASDVGAQDVPSRDTLQSTPPVDTVAPSGFAEPSVYLLTFGPGSRVYEVWGHNAIWIRDTARGLDATYNWGMFSFDQENFISRLAKGEMLYWMQGIPSDWLFADYIDNNRSIYAQELNLTLAEKAELVDYLLLTDTDANRYYRYDYYRDNCSTRVRDALDRVLGGRIAAALDTVQTGVTWRWQARRILRAMPFAYFGMEFALGNPAEETITEWEEAFLPLSLMRQLRAVTVTDATGREVPLVAGEFTVYEATRAAEPEEPPFWLPWFLLIGMAVGGLVVGAAWPAFRSRRVGAQERGRAGRLPGGAGLTLAGMAAVAWSLLVGTAGLLLLLAWLFTDHTFWHRNENLLQANPLSLLLAALLVVGHFGGTPPRWLRGTALAVLGVSVLGLLLQALPGFDQVNGEIIALALPVHAAVAWLVARLAAARSQAT